MFNKKGPETDIPAGSSKPWQKSSAPAQKKKSELVLVAGLFENVNKKNGEQYFRGKALKAIEANGVVIPANTVFLIFPNTKGKGKQNANLLFTTESEKPF